MTAMAGKRAGFYLTNNTASVAFAQEAMTDVSANRFVGFPTPAVVLRSIYQITNSAKRFWDPTVALTMEESLDSAVSWHAVVPDSVESAGGRFVFNASRQAAPAAMYRVSGSYMPWANAGGGHEWAAAPQIEVLESTEFPATSKTHTVNPLNSGSVQVKRWWLDDTMRAQMVAGAQMALVLWLDATAQPAGPRWEAFARLKASAVKIAVGALHTEDLTFELQSQLTFISS